MIEKKQNIPLHQLCSFAAVSLGGTLLHFAYDLFPSPITALFSGVNESTFEHMKLLFFPMLLTALIDCLLLRCEHSGYWSVKLTGILIGLGLIPILFYTLNGIFGKTPDFVNIGIFFISAAIAYLYETRALKKGLFTSKSEALSLIALLLIALIFFLFTFMPPKIPLFQDPVNQSYGI